MARIRTIKPEFWEHPKVTRVSRDARLLFLGLLNEADDEGKLRYSAKKLAGVLFGADDDVGQDDVERWTVELEREQLVMRYEVDCAPILLVRGFTEHQRVSHPSPSRLPSPPAPLATDSREPPEPDGKPPESLGPEGNREQGMEEEQGQPPVELVLDDGPGPDPIIAVFDAWRESTGRTRTVLDTKRRRAIVKALETHGVEDAVAAVRGWKHSPHHRGENTRNTVYNDIELLLRDAAHVEQFRDLERQAQAAAWSPALGDAAPPVRRSRCQICDDVGNVIDPNTGMTLGRCACVGGPISERPSVEEWVDA